MNCPACGADTPDGIKFCGECGARLPSTPHRCAACGFENPGHFKFCGECGSPLQPAARPSIERPDEAERRHLTVLFTDLVDSTQLAGRLDPEEFRDLVQRFQSACHEVIEHFGGHIAQLLGDGLLVYFGYPEAHEDDARRAVHAGLGIVRAITPLNEALEGQHGVRVACRVGIHAGDVVTGEMGTGPSRELLAMGQAPSVAARVQESAKPDTVVLTGAVDRLVRGYFDCEALGTRTLKGVAKPIDLLRVIRDSGVRDSFEVAVRRGLTPIAGRQGELERILACIDRVREGSGQVVLVSGEGGIGKSRLLNSLRERAGSELSHWLFGRCSPYRSQSALAPFIELVHDHFALADAGAPAEKLARITEGLEAIDLAPDEHLPIIAELLSIPTDGSYAPSHADPRKKREHTVHTLLTVLRTLASRGPAALVIEDLHWADPSTLEVLNLIVDGEPGLPCLTVLTHRPVFIPPWPAGANRTRIELHGLDPEHVVSMIGAVTGGMALPPDVLNQILRKTDGVPLFVEELTKMLIESDYLRPGSTGYEINGSLPPLTIPDTLQDSLRARLDRIGDARTVAQIASVLGRDFSYQMLHAVAEIDHADLMRYLDQLKHAGILISTGIALDATYTFNHALVEDAAYASLVKASRREYHRRAAMVLVDRFPDETTARPEIVAQHFTRAGEAESAVSYWLQAGRRAIDRFANEEAIEHLHRASELLASLPATAERYGKEIAIQTTLGSALVATRGYGAEDVGAAFSRAYALSEPMGDAPELFRALQGLWMFYVVRAEYGQALTLARRLERAAASQGRALRMQGLYTSAFTLFYLGDFAGARDRFQQAVTLDDGVTDFQTVSPTGDDIRVHVLSFLALTLWHLGSPDEALVAGRRAIAIARDSRHPYGIAWALMVAGWLHQFRGETDQMATNARESLAIAAEKGFSYIAALSSFLASLALALDPDREVAAEERGIGGMRQSIEALSASGARLGETLMTSQLIEASLHLGRTDAAADLIAEYHAGTPDREEQSWAAEFHRLRGLLELHRDLDNGAAKGHSLARAEAAFREAVATSEQQGARGLRLRAVHGLAQVLARLGRQPEAAELLSECLQSFSQGADTADVRNARTLLATFV